MSCSLQKIIGYAVLGLAGGCTQCCNYVNATEPVKNSKLESFADIPTPFANIPTPKGWAIETTVMTSEDFDGDGDLDLIVITGFIQNGGGGHTSLYAFENRNGEFVSVQKFTPKSKE